MIKFFALPVFCSYSKRSSNKHEGNSGICYVKRELKEYFGDIYLGSKKEFNKEVRGIN